jgi:predicted TIM-barrel fold metal-dependent hydrolase
MNRIIPFLAIAVLILQVGLAVPSNPDIVNSHESIESSEDILKLTSAMSALEMGSVVLHGIPVDFLRYNDEDEIDLSEVGDNHELIIEAVETYPGEFMYVCTIDPEDPNRMSLLQECLDDGAVGVKLYIGYSVAHTCNVDDPDLLPFLQEMTEEGLFLMLPVNVSKFGEELESMLTKHPELEVVCPHYCLSSKNLTGLSELLDEFPNLYVDTSFGSTDLVESGFERMSENHEEFVSFFENYQDRILFATDNVITSYEDKTEEWVTQLYSDYISMMVEEEFSSERSQDVAYHGLGLSFSIQQKVFWRNWDALIE